MQNFLKNNTGNRGFTLIELIVVAAIIALLVTIVAANVADTRNNAKNQVIQEDLSILREEGGIWINGHSNYLGFCDINCNSGSDAWKRICSSAQLQSGQVVNCALGAGNNSWCASARLAGSADYYCVDSANKAQKQAAACSNGACQP